MKLYFSTIIKKSAFIKDSLFYLFRNQKLIHMQIWSEFIQMIDVMNFLTKFSTKIISLKIVNLLIISLKSMNFLPKFSTKTISLKIVNLLMISLKSMKFYLINGLNVVRKIDMNLVAWTINKAFKFFLYLRSNELNACHNQLIGGLLLLFRPWWK